MISKTRLLAYVSDFEKAVREYAFSTAAHPDASDLNFTYRWYKESKKRLRDAIRELEI